MNKCDKCGRTLCATDEQIYHVEIAIDPCAEAPHGYFEEMDLCERCYLRYCEGLGEVDREVRR
jgi:hypothetical protein